ncbi:hypothetical protein QJS10_CPA10g01294 [Acorus calamus]|uniref:Uncharacterized protein n=1 Tax=Acorus calamus TaxID=4465 RepID=A0AAV9E1N7_ACOCL|nr:hypothetical protein QJS10_CPA10g01294 [Acorus calamus]
MSHLSHPRHPLLNPTRTSSLPFRTQRLSQNQPFEIQWRIISSSLPPRSTSPPPPPANPLKLHPSLLHIAAASAVFFVGLGGARACSPRRITTLNDPKTVIEDRLTEKTDLGSDAFEDNDVKTAFESWKSKTYALTVPLRIVSLRGSVPPSWIKDFAQAQGKRVKLNFDLRGSLESIFSDLSSASSKQTVDPKSVMAADLVTIGDSWLSSVISGGLVEPVEDAEGQDWFNSLSDKWKVHLRRNNKGEVDADGKIWGAPYRWGCMVIAYKKNKFKRHNLAPIEDWGDLWRPELAGKISMVDAPREIVGAVLKHMGASYNTKDINLDVAGGRTVVMENLAALQKQVRLFDSTYYLKAFGVGDVWVAVGWSSDVLPTAKRMSDVVVIVPKSGSSLWADIWAIPAATRFNTDRIGGRVRSPSPLIHQWIEFTLQLARASPFEKEVIPGAAPSAIDGPRPVKPEELTERKPKLDTNLSGGVPPSDILAKCEFLEPLSDKALDDYQWLISHMQKRSGGWIPSMIRAFKQFR